MKYALINSNYVENIFEADAAFAESLTNRGFNIVELKGIVGVNWEWNGTDFIEPLPPVPGYDARVWWINTGPYKDRFDKYGYPGLKFLILSLGRTNDVCYGIFADLIDRQYVDLLGRRDELSTALDMLSHELSELGKPALTQVMKDAILDTPTTEEERHIKGLA